MGYSLLFQDLPTGGIQGEEGMAELSIRAVLTEYPDINRSILRIGFGALKEAILQKETSHYTFSAHLTGELLVVSAERKGESDATGQE